LILVANASTGDAYVTTPWYLGSVPAERAGQGEEVGGCTGWHWVGHFSSLQGHT